MTIYCYKGPKIGSDLMAVFPKPPLLAYSRSQSQNIRDHLMGAKVQPATNKHKRIIPGILDQSFMYQLCGLLSLHCQEHDLGPI